MQDSSRFQHKEVVFVHCSSQGSQGLPNSIRNWDRDCWNRLQRFDASVTWLANGYPTTLNLQTFADKYWLNRVKAASRIISRSIRSRSSHPVARYAADICCSADTRYPWNKHDTRIADCWPLNPTSGKKQTVEILHELFSCSRKSHTIHWNYRGRPQLVLPIIILVLRFQCIHSTENSSQIFILHYFSVRPHWRFTW